MRFIADAMLGRLAKWLRLLGFDTLYQPGISDRTLLRLAMEQGRVILTRDSHFLRKDIENCLMVKSDFVQEQLSQIIEDLRLEPPSIGRCVNCNGELAEVGDKTDVRDSVPEYVYMSTNRFHRCARCGKVYWEGSHYSNFTGRLLEVIKQAHRSQNGGAGQ
jgi:uncharacterized protein with PIN domain